MASPAVLPLFSRLWDSKIERRVSASASLVAHLVKKQNGHAEEAKRRAQDSSVEETQTHVDSTSNDPFHFPALDDEVGYSMKRLIRALASPRENSRLGFSVALTELLANLPDLDSAHIVNTITTTTAVTGNLSGSEERDLLFARLFGLHACFDSGLLTKPTSTLLTFNRAISEIAGLGEKKSYLRESCGWSILEAAKRVWNKTEEELSWRERGLSVLLEAAFSLSSEADSSKSFSNQGKEWTLERLALVIYLQRVGYTCHWEGITQSTFPNPLLLSDEKNLGNLAEVLRGITRPGHKSISNGDVSAGKNKNELLGTGQLHQVWKEIVEAYLENTKQGIDTDLPKKKKAKVDESTIKPGMIPFEQFYKVAVDDNLLGNTCTIPLKYVGLLFFTHCATVLSTSTSSSSSSSISLPTLITPNLTRTLINHASATTRTLNSVAKQATNTIPLAVKASPGTGFDVLMRLFGVSPSPSGSGKDPENVRFDAATKSKTVDGVVAAMDEESVNKYQAWLREYILNQGGNTANADGEDEAMEGDKDGEDEEETNQNKTKAIESKQMWAIDQLVLLIKKHHKSSSTPTATAEATGSDDTSTPLPTWAITILNFLSLHGFFILAKSSKKSPLLKQLPSHPFSPKIQDAFRTRFNSAISCLVVENVRCKRGEEWIRNVLETVQGSYEGDERHLKALNGDEETRTERKETVDVLRRIQKQSSGVSGLRILTPIHFSLFSELRIHI